MTAHLGKATVISSFRFRVRPSGFTLIELIVIIAIVAILAAITFGMVGRARETAHKTQCASNLRQIAVALNAYSADNDGRFPAVRRLTPSIYWYMALAKYLGAPINPNTGAGYSEDIAPVFRCPSAVRDFGASSKEQVYRTYMASDLMRGRNASGAKDWAVPIVPSALASKSDSVVCIDGARSGADFACTSGTVWSGAQGLISYRHGETANALFFDGHVSAVRPGDLTQEMWNAP